MRWLTKEAYGRQVGFWMIGCLILQIAYDILFVGFVYFLKIIDISSIIRDAGIPIFTFFFPIRLIGGVFIEELIFRLPLAVVSKRGWSIARVLAIAFALSAIFGVVHGGVQHIFIQGVGGFIYSVLFLKCGGFQGNYSKAFAITFVTHLLRDMVAIGILIVRGATSI